MTLLIKRHVLGYIYCYVIENQYDDVLKNHTANGVLNTFPYFDASKFHNSIV